MQAALQDAEPRACLAVRLARTHDSAAEPPPLLECELCGGARPASRRACRCSVSGEVIGSVLVEHARPLHGDEHRRIEDSVSQAAPDAREPAQPRARRGARGDRRAHRPAEPARGPGRRSSA